MRKSTEDLLKRITPMLHAARFDRPTSFDIAEEIEALRHEARYWQAKAVECAERAEIAERQARGCGTPNVTMEMSPTGQYHRVFVNGVFIEGWEEESTAARMIDRLNEAFKKETPAEAPSDPEQGESPRKKK